MANDLLWTPILNHPSQCCLFRIVTNVGAKPIDGLAEVVISAMNHFSSCHAWLKCCLFRIVTNVGAKPIDGLAEVVISAMNHFSSCHAWLK